MSKVKFLMLALVVTPMLALMHAALTKRPTTGAGPLPAPGSLLLECTFENAGDLGKWEKEICRPDAITITQQVAREGKAAARFEFTKTDVLRYNGFVRAEIRQHSEQENERWYGFSNYLPVDFIADGLAEIIAQWHEVPDWDLGETWRSPPVSLSIKNDRYYVQVLWAAARVNTNRSKDGEKIIDLGPVDRERWNDWVFHIRFSWKADGLIEIWKNKQRILTLQGPNSFNDEHYPYFKIGIYKWGWNGWASYSPAEKRVLYYDEVRIGNRDCTLDDVSPH